MSYNEVELELIILSKKYFYYFFQEIIVFVDTPNKKLFCRLCGRVFKDPVIVSCGVSILVSNT